MKYPDAVPLYQGKSQRERNIEQRLKWQTAEPQRSQLKAELDDLRRGRRRDSAWDTRMAAGAGREKVQEERHLRAQSGSRFNIRYNEVLPAEAMTPAGIRKALHDYIDLPSESVGDGETQVAQMVQEGSLEIMQRTYQSDSNRIDTKFVGGVLIQYTITPV